MRIGKFTSILIALVTMAAVSSTTAVFFDARLEPPSGRVLSGWGQFSSAWDLGQPTGNNPWGFYEPFNLAAVDCRRLHAILPSKGWPDTRLGRWLKVAAYVKQQLGDPRFIEASEAPAIFRPSMSER